jgi:hypothetical protein
LEKIWKRTNDSSCKTIKNSHLKNSIAFEQFVKRQALQTTTTISYLKIGIWLYFILLIFEGALRKWFLPFLATPLLIVRDPIAMWVVITAINKRILQFNGYLVAICLISVISFFTAITIGHGNTVVALFGLRILMIHFPFMFAMGAVFTNDDVIKIGKVTLWIAIPMAVLIGLQFYSPQTAWVNRGVGGDESGAGFSGALGYFRPPGTFSFTNGNSAFFSFAAIFVFYFFLNVNKVNRILLIGATIALLAAVPLSISRSLIFSIIQCAAFMLIALTRKRQNAGRVVIGTIGAFILFLIISQFSFFQTATEAMTERYTSATEGEGGLQGVFIDRYLGGLVGAITNSSQLPFFGYGLGMGTNVGAMLLSGKRAFLIAEGEWGRLIGELGLLLGLLLIILRVGFCLQISFLAFRRLLDNDVLPWMMLSFAILIVPQGQWAQPTSLGFSTLAGGLILASFHKVES